VLSGDYTIDKNTIIPNQGFIDSKNVYAKPTSNSAIIHEKLSSQVRITRREKWLGLLHFSGRLKRRMDKGI